jgi:hypothetical protein
VYEWFSITMTKTCASAGAVGDAGVARPGAGDGVAPAPWCSTVVDPPLQPAMITSPQQPTASRHLIVRIVSAQRELVAGRR